MRAVGADVGSRPAGDVDIPRLRRLPTRRLGRHSDPGHDLGVVTGLSALSLDALSSVAYGPEGDDRRARRRRRLGAAVDGSVEDENVTSIVLIPEIIPKARRHEILHNQRGRLLETVLRARTDVVIATLPFHIRH